jgi:hypothetical protein
MNPKSCISHPDATYYSEELKWMQESNGKREIEAVYDSWKGGLVGYLVWKIKQILQVEEDEMDWIGSDDLDDDLVDIADLINDMFEI